MNKEFIPYEQALELEKLGFDEACFAYYDEEDQEKQVYEYANCSRNITGDRACYNDDFLSVTNTQLDKHGAFSSKDDEDTESYSRWTAPLYQQAFRWFRDKHSIHCYIDITIEDKWFFCLFNLSSKRNAEIVSEEPTYYNTYEEAELACLKKLIEIVKGGNK